MSVTFTPATQGSLNIEGEDVTVWMPLEDFEGANFHNAGAGRALRALRLLDETDPELIGHAELYDFARRCLVVLGFPLDESDGPAPEGVEGSYDPEVTERVTELYGLACAGRAAGAQAVSWA